MCKGPEMGQDSGCEELPDYCGGRVRRGMKREKTSCVTLDETGEVCRVFRAVKNSGLYLKMVGKLLNSFKQRSDMILNRESYRVCCLNCYETEHF